MSRRIRKIAILTGGGDVPGLNVAIKQIVRRALDQGIEVVGFRRGWGGLVDYRPGEKEWNERCVLPLTWNRVRTIDRTGGTFLHTSRTNPGKMREKDLPDHLRQEKMTYPVDVTDTVVANLHDLGVDALVPIGGDDTLSYAARLNLTGFPLVAIPKTMDNDVFGTDYCLGFGTAITRSVQFINDLRTPIGSHERIGVIELFGRNSGETSLVASYLAGVDRAIISEIPFDIEKLAAFLVEDKAANPSNYVICTISEGAKMVGGRIIERGERDAYGHRKLGGVGQQAAEQVKELTGQNVTYQQLGYMMRCGPPDSLDRMVAMNYGNLAMDMLLSGASGLMVALQEGKYTTVGINTVIDGLKRVDVDRFYDVEQYRPVIRRALGLPMFLR